MKAIRMAKKIYRISRTDVLKCLFFAVISAIISTPLQLFNSIIIEGIAGPPSFVTIPFLVYAISMKFFFAIGYILIGYKLPIKRTRLRAFLYMMLILSSSYLPNILAMAGGDGKIIESSLSVNIVILDCISYTLDGLILGLLMKNYMQNNDSYKSALPNRKLIACCLTNGILFLSLLFVFDLICGAINSSWYLYAIMEVSEMFRIRFYIVFYIFMFIAGVLQPIWIRFTLYPDTAFKATVIWVLVYSIFVWNPVVLIMVFFGTAITETLCYAGIFIFIFLVCVFTTQRVFFYKLKFI